MIDNILLFLPRDSTCLPIEQHVFCEATWEQSHWGLGLPLGSFERGKKNGPKGACDGGRSNRSKANREPNAISFYDKQGTGSRNTTEGQGSQNGPGLAMSLHTFLSPLSLPEWEKQPQEIPKGHVYFEPMKRDYPSMLSGMHISFPCLPCETLPDHRWLQRDPTRFNYDTLSTFKTSDPWVRQDFKESSSITAVIIDSQTWRLKGWWCIMRNPLARLQPC